MGNPNRVNQYTEPDPRQSLFLSYYLDPKSDTFSNALQSGLKAGFTEEYSTNLLSLMPKWLSETLDESKYLRMLKKAEARLEVLAESEDEKVGLEASKFISGRLGKRIWSDRTEITGENGKAINITLSPEIADKYDTHPSTTNNS